MSNGRIESSRTLSASEARNQASSLFLAKVFTWMAAGLGLTALTAFAVAGSPALVKLIFGNQLLFFGLIIAELVMVFVLASRVDKMSAGAATGLFVAYSVLNGVTLSVIFLAYTAVSIATTFITTAGMFGGMAIYGLVTKRDLSSWGSFLFMGLIGIIIAMLVNFFLHSPALAWAISAIGVIVFTGLTAYDVQNLTRMAAAGIMENGAAAVRRYAILGALRLYLDFINLFLMLLNFMGERR